MYVVTVPDRPTCLSGLAHRGRAADRSRRDHGGRVTRRAVDVPADVRVVPPNEIRVLVTTPQNQPLTGNPQFCSTRLGTARYHGRGVAETCRPPPWCRRRDPAKISLDPGTAAIDNTVPGVRKIAFRSRWLAQPQPGSGTTSGVNTVALEYQYSLTDQGPRRKWPRKYAGAMIDIFDRAQNLVGDRGHRRQAATSSSASAEAALTTLSPALRGRTGRRSGRASR